MKMILRLDPKLKHTVNESCLEWDGKEVTVESWHAIPDRTKEIFPNDVKVGFVKEFSMDIPESELKYS